MVHRKLLFLCLPLSAALLCAASAAASPTCTTLTTGSASIGDVYINSANPTTNFVTTTTDDTGVGHHNAQSYTLLHIDTSFIPAGATINSATVTLQQVTCSGCGSTVDAYYVLGGWNPDSVTWDDFTAGYSSYPVATFASGSGPVSFDLTSLTQAWVDGTITNYGLLLLQSSGATAFDFSPSENLQIFNVCYTGPNPAPAAPALSLQKTVNTVNACPGNTSVTVAPGTQVTECYSVTNTGNVPVSGIVVADNGATINIGTLAPGATGTGSSTAAVTASSDTAAVATGSYSGTAVSSSASEAPINVLTSSLSLQKTVSLTGSCPGQSSVSVQSGTTVMYCYLVTNTGQLTVDTVVVNDSGLSVTVGGLAPGQSDTVFLEVDALANSNAPAVASGVDTSGDGVQSAQSSAAVNVVPSTYGLDATCETSGTYFTISNPAYPAQQVGTCADGDGLTLAEAVTYCNGNVSYFAYTCTDFPASLPYQPQNQRAWTGNFGCCTPPGGPTCHDGVMDGTETDIDCGGQCPLACLVGQGCNYDTDCQSDYCHHGTCKTPTVLDSTCVNNGLNDTLHNVGWPSAEDGTCAGGYEAFTIDDAAAQCPGGVVKYFDYTCTDIPNPPPYQDQRTWESDFSCCYPECSDGIRDGSETDVDCGGQCPLACYPGQTCVCDSDCRSDYCAPNDQGVYVCQIPPVLQSECTSAGNDTTLHNAGYPAHEVGNCDQCWEGFTIDDAAALCPGGVVKYFDYTCTDFPAVPPYQPQEERAWEADYACCVPGTY